MDRLQAMEVFAAVAEQGGFAAGARSLGLSPPSATRLVNALEDHLGAKLLTRTTRSLRLTEVGRVYLEECRQIAAAVRAAEETASGAHVRPTGHLRITSPIRFGRLYIVPVLTAFLDAHPDVTIEVVLVDRMTNLVEEGFDIALRIGPLPDSGLSARKVGEVRRVVCASSAYLSEHGTPKRPADLTGHRIISAAPVTPSREWRFADEAVVPVRPRLTVGTVEAAIAAAEEGWGITRVLSYQIGAQVAAGTLERLLREHEPEALPVHLVHAEGRQAAAKVRAFVDFAAERLRASADYLV